MPPLPSLTPQDSQLVVSITVAKRALLDAIAARVPTVLAPKQRRDLGIAGRAEFSVTRGGFGLGVEPFALNLTVPVTSSIEICKPFAGSCLRYGHCSPELMVSFHLPLELGDDAKPPRVASSVRAARGCSLAGLDWTPQLLEEARPQVHRAAADADAQLRSLLRTLRDGWRRAQTPLPLSSQACLSFRPAGLGLSPLSQKEDQLSFSLSVEGRLSVADCAAEAPVTLPLPALAALPELDASSRLHLTQLITWEHLSERWTHDWQGNSLGTPPLQSVVATGVLVDEAPHALLELRFARPDCGPLWLVAELGIDGSSRRLRVGRVTQLGAPQFDGTQWRQWLEGHGVLELPELATLAAVDVEAAIAALTGATPGVTLRSTLSPISIEIEGVGREGLLAAAVTNGALEARVQSLAGLR